MINKHIDLLEDLRYRLDHILLGIQEGELYSNLVVRELESMLDDIQNTLGEVKS
jgi:hypothetical protein